MAGCCFNRGCYHKNETKMKSNDPYFITHRIDWARSRLETGQPFNSTYLMGEFGITQRTAHRDIRYIRRFYGERLQYDYRDRMYFLKIRQAS
jgi:hypothetical protein